MLWEKGKLTKNINDISVHGGTYHLPSRITSNSTQNSRIQALTVTGIDNTEINQFWIGIKASRHFPLSEFDPAIEVKRGSVDINTGFSGWSDSVVGVYFHQTAVQVNYANGTDWARAFSTTLPRFNSTTAAGISNVYHGKYHLLARYHTSADFGETYGIRAKFGWNMDRAATTLEPIYLKPTSDYFRYVDLGVITIGGDSFSYESIKRANLNTFGIAIQSAVWDRYVTSENKSILYLDNMRLVPAEHYIYAELTTPIGGRSATRRAEIYINEDNSTYGLVVERDDASSVGSEITYSQDVHETISIIDGGNWSMPITNSKIVLVASSDFGSSTTSTAMVDIIVRSRTVGI